MKVQNILFRLSKILLLSLLILTLFGCNDSKRNLVPAEDSIPTDTMPDDSKVSSDKGIFFAGIPNKALRINSGGFAYLDSQGRSWLSDKIYYTDNIRVVKFSTDGVVDKFLYQSMRLSGSSEPQFNYNISLLDGEYIIKFHFAETLPEAFSVGKRIFNVRVENEVLLESLDVFKEAGANTALMKSVPVTVGDGELNISFQDVVGKSFVNAVEIESRLNIADDAPEIISNPIVVTGEGVTYFYDVEVAESNIKERFSFTLITAPVGMSINPTTGLIQWLPSIEQLGLHDIKIVVSDKGNPATADSQSFSIDVVSNISEISINTIAITVAQQGVPYVYDVGVSDINTSRNLIYSLSESPVGMNINEGSGKIEWTPGPAQVGEYNVAVIVGEEGLSSMSATQRFIISVSAANQKPNINSNVILEAVEGIEYSYDVDASDANVEDELTFSLSLAPIGMSINAVSGMISWTPTLEQVGNNNVAVTVTDNGTPSLSGNQQFSINVLKKGLLAGRITNAPSSVYLTANGSADWIHWGLKNEADVNRKAGVIPQISNYSPIDGATPPQGINSLTLYSWADGTPTNYVTNTNTGLRAYKINKGFEFTVPADTTQRTLKVFVGAKNAGGVFEASLSDGSAPKYSSHIDKFSGIASRVVNIDFKANSVGQMLTVRYTLYSLPGTVGSGWVSLEAALLEGEPTVSSLFNEDFSSELNSDWTVVDDSDDSSNWNITNGKYRQNNFVGFNGNAMEGGYHLGTYSALDNFISLTDYQFNVEAMSSADSGQDIGVMIHVNPETDSYIRLSFSAANGFGRLEKKSGGTFTTLAKNARGYLHGVPQNISMEVKGSVIIAKVNGEKLFGAYDEDLKSGSVGLYCRDNCSFDNVNIQNNSVIPTVVISEPTSYSVSPGATFNVSAVVLNAPAGATVEFQLDERVAACTNTNDFGHLGLFTGACTALSQGTYKLTAVLKDSFGIQLDTDTNVDVSVGDNYIAIGDSISIGLDDNTVGDGASKNGWLQSSMGYEARLMDHLAIIQPQPSIIHKSSTPGDTSSDSESLRLASVLERHVNANKAIIILGVNDSSGVDFIPSGLGCSGLACNGTYKGNLQLIIDRLEAAGKSSLVALSPPRFGDPRQVPYLDPANHSRNLLIRDEYNQIISTELTNHKVGPDFYDYFLGSENRFYLYARNLHPNALGYAVIADLLRNSITGNVTPIFVVNKLCVRLAEAGPCLNPLTYKENLLEVGNAYYVDQVYTLVNQIPPILSGGRWIMTSDGDRNLNNLDYLSFNVPETSTLYVAYDAHAATLPDWLVNNFIDTSVNLDTDNPLAPSMRLYSQSNVLGKVILSGADALLHGAVANYLVIVVKD